MIKIIFSKPEDVTPDGLDGRKVRFRYKHEVDKDEFERDDIGEGYLDVEISGAIEAVLNYSPSELISIL
jgi:hypothetical protein